MNSTKAWRAPSKRLYRFLDKRFYQRQRLEFDLRTFSCDHIGLSKNYHNGELKRVLTPAIQELEKLGYIETVSSEERFLRKARGEWSVVFVRASKQTARLAESSPLVQALIERGISAPSARRIASQTASSIVEEKIALVDWLSARKDPRVQKNPAGFLYRAITENFPLPEDYRRTQQPKKLPQANVVSIKRRAAAPTPPTETSDRSAIETFWNSLSAEERNRIEAELVEKATPFQKQHYKDGQKERGPLFRVVPQ